MPDAIRFRQDNDWDEVARDCQALAQDTAARVARRTGLAPFSSGAFCAPQMVAMPVPRTDPMALKRDLLSRFGIEIPCFDWKDAHTIVRLSVQGYNTPAQMDMLVDALTDILHLTEAA